MNDTREAISDVDQTDVRILRLAIQELDHATVLTDPRPEDKVTVSEVFSGWQGHGQAAPVILQWLLARTDDIALAEKAWIVYRPVNRERPARQAEECEACGAEGS